MLIAQLLDQLVQVLHGRGSPSASKHIEWPPDFRSSAALRHFSRYIHVRSEPDHVRDWQALLRLLQRGHDLLDRKSLPPRKKSVP